MITIGDQAPNFSFTNQDGKSISLGDFLVNTYYYGGTQQPILLVEQSKEMDSVIESKILVIKIVKL